MKVLLIPSAVLMPREMRKSFGDLPTGLFPLGDRPMISILYDRYKGLVDKIFVVAYEKKDKVENYIKKMKLPIELISLDRLDDLGYTIAYGCEYILDKEEKVDYLYINFADSLLDDTLPEADRDFVYYAEREMDDQWTWFTHSEGKIEHVFDKGAFKLGKIPAPYYEKLFVGVFGISNIRDFMGQFYQTKKSNETDRFYQTIVKYSDMHSVECISSMNWFDVGHNENYVKAQTRVAARSFNSIKIDEERGVLTKFSDNKEKLINEIQWYLRIPKQLQYLLPRIYDYSLDFDTPYVTMEYYGYHTLHESLLYGDLSLLRWKKIFEKLLFAIADMQSFSIKGREKEITSSIYEMYLNKTIQRLEKLRNKKEFEKFFHHKVIINERVHRSLDEILEILPNQVERLLIPNADKYFSVIHGDLCFTNILVEDTYNFMRLIDPRGKFGSFDIYGDSRYELAKLFHTLEGNYDYIIEDMFDIDVKGSSITYAISSGNNIGIWNIFQEVFRNKLDCIKAIRLIESTLFLSMIPLHSDSLNRQYAMLATGVSLFDEVIE